MILILDVELLLCHTQRTCVWVCGIRHHYVYQTTSNHKSPSKENIPTRKAAICMYSQTWTANSPKKETTCLTKWQMKCLRNIEMHVVPWMHAVHQVEIHYEIWSWFEFLEAINITITAKGISNNSHHHRYHPTDLTDVFSRWGKLDGSDSEKKDQQKLLDNKFGKQLFRGYMNVLQNYELFEVLRTCCHKHHSHQDACQFFQFEKKQCTGSIVES